MTIPHVQTLLAVGGAPDPGVAPDQIAEAALLWLWLEAGVDATTAALNDNDPVALWEDLSSNSIDMDAPAAPDEPTYKTGILNGLPVVRFDGAGDRLFNGTDPGGVNDGVLIAVVAMAASPTTARNTVLCWEGITATHQFNARGSDADGNDVSIAWNGTLRTGTTELPTDGSFHVVAWRHKPAAPALARAWVDGTLVMNVGAGAGQSRISTRVGSATSSVNFLKGDIAALAAYTGDVSESNLFEVAQYFAAIYGLPDWT